MVKMKIMMIKESPWTLKGLCKSEHPEWTTLRNLILRKRIHQYLLIGFCPNRFQRLKVAHNVTFINLPIANFLRILSSLLYTAFIQIIFRPNVVVVFGCVSPGFTGLGACFAHAKFIAIITGELHYVPSRIYKPFYHIYRLLFKVVIRHADVIMTVSESVKKEVIDSCKISSSKVISYRYKISSIFNPYVPKDLKLTFNLSGPIVLTCCRINPQKGLHYIIEATKMVVQNISNVRFIIKGRARTPLERRYKKYLKTLISEYNLKNNCYLIDKDVPYSCLPKYYAMGDVFVLPSVSEALGIVIMEALACGVPVVATNVGGIPEIVYDGVNGFLVNPGDVDALANRIKVILTNDELRKRLSDGAIKTIKRFNINEFEILLRKYLYS